MGILKQRHARKRLVEEIVKLSVADDFEKARLEWVVTDLVHQEVDDNVRCVCGSTGIKDIYTVRNLKNGNVIANIGSSCVDFFGTEEVKSSKAYLNRRVSARKFYEENSEDFDEYIDGLTKSQYSEKFFLYLYELGIIQPTRSNYFAPINDVHFLWSSLQTGISKLTSEERSRFSQLWSEVILPWILGNPTSELYLKRVSDDMLWANEKSSEVAYDKQLEEYKEELLATFNKRLEDLESDYSAKMARSEARVSEYREAFNEKSSRISELTLLLSDSEKELSKVKRDLANQTEVLSKTKARLKELSTGVSRSYESKFRLPELDFRELTFAGKTIKKHSILFYRVRDEVKAGGLVNYQQLTVASVCDLLYRGVLSISDFNTFVYYKSLSHVPADFYQSPDWVSLESKLRFYFANLN